MDISTLISWLVAAVALGGALWAYRNGNNTATDIFIEVGNLRQRVGEQERIIQEQRRRIQDLEAQLAELRGLYYESLQRENQALLRVEEMVRQVQAMRRAATQGSWMNVLGVWPQTELNAMAVRDALYDLGIPYRALSGQVGRADIIRALEEDEYTVLEIDAHGVAGGIKLSDEYARPGWWMQTIRRYGRHVRLAVLMACDSWDAARAIRRAGVQWVVGLRGPIRDDEAVQFLVHFYEALASGSSVQDALERGKAVITLDQADMVLLLD